MPDWFTPEDRAVVVAATERLIPAHDRHPGATALGVVDYIDGLLGAFAVDPPRIWAGGPFSGRHGGQARFGEFLPLSRVEEQAWRTRIGDWQARYRDGLDRLGADYAGLAPEDQDARLAADPGFRALLYEHACEGAYAAPEYGGNRDGAGWAAIGFGGDSQPRGYTDAEVSEP